MTLESHEYKYIEIEAVMWPPHKPSSAPQWRELSFHILFCSLDKAVLPGC